VVFTYWFPTLEYKRLRALQARIRITCISYGSTAAVCGIYM
jgi:hypothetical protein